MEPGGGSAPVDSAVGAEGGDGKAEDGGEKAETKSPPKKMSAADEADAAAEAGAAAAAAAAAAISGVPMSVRNSVQLKAEAKVEVKGEVKGEAKKEAVGDRAKEALEALQGLTEEAKLEAKPAVAPKAPPAIVVSGSAPDGASIAKSRAAAAAAGGDTTPSRKAGANRGKESGGNVEDVRARLAADAIARAKALAAQAAQADEELKVKDEAKPKGDELANLEALEALMGLTEDGSPAAKPKVAKSPKAEEKKHNFGAGMEGVEGMEVNPAVYEAPRVDQLCEMCAGGHHEDQMILCDKCDNGYHMYCLIPPLEGVPPGDWFCPNCIAVEKRATDVHVGFKPGKTYTLNEYSAMAKAFKNKWCARGPSRPPYSEIVTRTGATDKAPSTRDKSHTVAPCA